MQETRRRRWRLAWAIASAASIIAAAAWLREPAIGYVVVGVIATAAAIGLALRLPAGTRRLAAIVAIGQLLFCLLAGVAERTLWRIDREWPAYRAAAQSDAAAALRQALDESIATLERTAAAALEAPREPAGAAFEVLQSLASAGNRSIVLLHADTAVAWGGLHRIPLEVAPTPLGVAFTPFYIALSASADAGDGRRAVATTIVHAASPADRLVRAVDDLVAARSVVKGFRFRATPAASGEVGAFVFAPRGAPLFAVEPLALRQDETRQRIVETARLRGALALALMLAAFVAAVWVHAAALPARLAALAVALMVVAMVPLNAFSNATRIFDPAIYFAPLGGPLTGSIGALAITSALLLLGLLAVLRARLTFPARWMAGAGVLLIAGLGPFLLRDLARGINPPAWRVSIDLWIGWQVALFLAALAILLAGVSAGQVVLGGRRGVSPLLAPFLAGTAALLGPIVLTGQGRWPEWYSALWIAAIGALALARSDRRSILSGAIVAGLGAATLVWGATVRQRVELARNDIAALERVDETAVLLLERFREQLTESEAPETREALLRAYISSDLAAADYPIALTSWSPTLAQLAELRLGGIASPREDLRAVASEALDGGLAVLRSVAGIPGVRLLLAVPDENYHVTTVAVEPRTRLTPDDPFALLVGIAPDPTGEAPYTMALTRHDGRADAPVTPVWERRGDELHGDYLVETRDGPHRAHVEVALRSLDTLIPRGALILLLDLAILSALWGLSASADGGFARWLAERRDQWAHSYRAQLTLALFLFFVVPAFLFAAWAYRRLQSDELQSRELVVREALRTIAGGEQPVAIDTAPASYEMPLLLYEDGRLTRSSDPLYESLAPTGRLLDPAVYLSLDLGDEVTASRVLEVGPVETLFGYRAATDVEGDRVILAAPAPLNESAFGGRRRDLGVLVMFTTVLGALAALWLSGLAARQLARPIGALRRAALAIAAGDREPPLALEPPSEFEPVFTAFRRMATDLDTSRRALEDAHRRTAAILRNVASGVIALDRDRAAVTLANPRADALLARPLPPGTPLTAFGAPALEARVGCFLDGEEEEEEFDLELHGRRMHVRLTRLVSGRGGAVMTLDDLTELARAQRVLAWGEMARQVAHEIKNPLTPIRLGVQHLRRARSDPRVDFDRVLDQNVSRILAEIDRLDEIARSFSRYGSAPAEREEPEPTDVARVVRDVVALETMGEGSVRWAVTGAEQPLIARARGSELREVLLNVLENSRLAGATEVAVRLGQHDGVVRIVVEDDGEGIPPEVLPRIFEPHFSTRTSGSGLGLAVSRRLIDGWGGGIAVFSERGRGTRVEIELVAAAD